MFAKLGVSNAVTTTKFVQFNFDSKNWVTVSGRQIKFDVLSNLVMKNVVVHSVILS